MYQNTAEKKKISVFLYQLVNGGAERVAITLHNNFPDDYAVNILTLYDMKNAYYDTNAPHLMKYHSKPLIRLLTYPIAVTKLIQHRLQERPDLVLSLNEPTNFVNLISSLLGFKVVISFHTLPSYSNTFLSKLTKLLLIFMIHATNPDIIVLSEGMKKEFCDAYHIARKDKVHTIYNPIYIADIQNKSQVSDTLPSILTDNIPNIITVGRLDPEKAQWHSIRAFAKLREKIKCRLLICGTGSEEEYLKSLVHKLNIDNDVVFLGWQKNPYVFMSHSSLLVHSSLTEAFGNVFVEAMAVGCPVVVAECSLGITEIIGPDNKCGIITKKVSGIRHEAFNPLDEGEYDLFENMQKIILNHKLHDDMALCCKERAKLFDVNIGINKYRELFENICSR